MPGRKETIGELVAVLSADTSRLKKALKEADGSLGTFTKKSKSRLKTFAKYASLYFGSKAVKNFARDVLNAGVMMEQLRLGAGAAAGSLTAGGAAMEYVKEQAERMGFVFQDRVKDFKLLAAAARGTVLQGEATVEIFEALTTAGVALQLSSEETGGAILAVSQMMSKGKITAEELRLQLAERFPGAVRIMADSLGVTVKELDKMLERGEIGIDVLEEFAHRLKAQFGGAAIEASKSLRAELNRLSTAWFKFKVSVFESPVGDFMAWSIERTRKSLDAARRGMEAFGVEAEDVGKRISLVGSALKSFFGTTFEIIKSKSTDAIKAVINGVKPVDDMAERTMPKIVSLTETWAEKTKDLLPEIEKVNKAYIEAKNILAAKEGEDTRQSMIDALGVGGYKTDFAAVQSDWENMTFEMATGMQASSQIIYDEFGRIADVVNVNAGEFEQAGKRSYDQFGEIFGLSQQYWADEETGWTNMKLWTEAAFGARLDLSKKVDKVEQMDIKNKAKLQKAAGTALLDNTSFALKAFGEKNRAAFEAFKAVEIAKTIVTTIDSAQGAFASFAWMPAPVGPTLAYAAAAAAIVAGMARVQQIRSMTPESTYGGGGGSGGGGVGGTPSMPTPMDIEEFEEKEPQTQIIIQNPQVDSEERLRDLMDGIRRLSEKWDVPLAGAGSIIE